MKITELMTKIASLFPHQFSSQEQVDTWAPVYKASLREGPALEDAWNDCIASWTKKDAPKPADIAKCVRPERQTKDDMDWGWIQDRLPSKVAEIVLDALTRGMTRCDQCCDGKQYADGPSVFPDDCRCTLWQDANEMALRWLQREYWVTHKRALDNWLPQTLSDDQLRGIMALRSAGKQPPLVKIPGR